MRKYEIVILVDHDVPHQGVSVISKKVESLLGDGGKIISSEYWGMRELAYTIGKHKKARYFMLSVFVLPESIKSITDYIGINESIIRFGVYSVEAFDEGSAMLNYKKGLVENIAESDYRAIFPNPVYSSTINSTDN